MDFVLQVGAEMMMIDRKMLLMRFLLICLFALMIRSQQQYSANSILACNSSGADSSDLLYMYNGQRPSCQAYLIFKSQPPYDSVPNISFLMSVDQTELARVNNVTTHAVFETNKEVIVPVNCFSSGQYYQANTTYQIPASSTYLIVANDTYQGLSTCDALRHVNPYGELDLLPGMYLQVPLRCACPTTNQTAKGTKYLLTYSVSWGDHISDISNRFHVKDESLLEANELSEDKLFPFTTVLIPLETDSLSSYTIIQNKKHVDSPSEHTTIFHTTGKTSKPNYKYVGVGMAIGSSLAVLIGILCVVTLLCRKSTEKRYPTSEERETNLIVPKDLLSEIASNNQSLRVFKYAELNAGTKTFSSKNLIKGSVYLGEIRGIPVAIKRTSKDVSKEVRMLNKANHFNLTELHGICLKQDNAYLVYEYVENGSLREWLRNENSRECGSWMRRIQIALDVANGLHYLHNFIEPAYVHKNIKSSNILLNRDLRAKITNFGHGKTASKGTRNVSSTNNIVGTRGYMAPEYIKMGAVTTKLDVYAFGVVMIELLTGRCAVTFCDGKEVSLRDELITMINVETADAELGNFIDPRLLGVPVTVFALRVVRFSMACLENDPERRPNMDEVASSLLKLQADMHKSQIYVT